MTRHVEETVVPASAAQTGMWLTTAIDPGSPAFNVSHVARVRGPLDVYALRTAVEGLVARHEVLRTRLRRHDGGVVQVVAARGDVTVGQHDVSGSGRPAVDREAAALAIAEESVNRSFDLAGESLVRVDVVRLDAEYHLLVIVLHHALCDGESFRLLLTELSDGYRAAIAGRRPGGGPEPRRYRDVAAAEREWADTPEAAAGLAHWRDVLRGCTPVDPFGYRSPPPDAGGAAMVQRFDWSADMVESLDRTARAARTTRFTVMVAAVQVMLARLSGRDDVAVGTTVSTRSDIEDFEVVGPLFSTVVLRGDLTGDPTFAELVRRTHHAVTDALEHGRVPFEDVLRHCRDVVPGGGRNPLFSLLFESTRDTVPPLTLPDADVTTVPCELRTAKTDLAFALRDTGDGIVGTLTHRLDVCDAVAARTLCDRLTTVVRGALDDPERTVSALPLVPGREARVLDGFASGGTADLPEVCAHELFTRQALATPDAPAVVEHRSDGARVTLTFAELDARANALAHRLVAGGVGPEVRVGIHLPRGADLMISMLAVWKAGGAYVPLDAALPRERLRYLTEDSGAILVLSRRDVTPPADDLGVPVLLLDEPAGHDVPTGAPAPAVGPRNLCYVMYTSGSTGRPKGVLVEHRSLVNFLMWCLREYFRDGDGGAALFSSVAYDMVVPNMFPPLLVGRPVHLLPPDLEPLRLGDALLAGAPYAFLKLTPGHLELLTQQLTAQEARNLAGLMVVGADAFQESTLARWRELAPDTPVMNEYGPTEATVSNCVHLADSSPSSDSGLLPIGRPIPNTTTYVLDEHLEQVPVGVLGEIFIGGDCVVRGYASKPRQTARAFVPDPFGPPGSRLYRTGDVGRWLPGGAMDFLGRIDHQVKINGYRVEPAELEASLTGHPAVHACVVLPARLPSGHTVLVAYVVGEPADGTPDPLDEVGLRRHVAAELPNYMVPARIIELDRIPLNPNGKVDRGALPPLSSDSGDDVPVTALTDREHAVATVWSDLLGMPATDLRATDGFFERGGSSLLVLTLLERVRDHFGVRLPFDTFLRQPTVRGLADAVETARTAGHTGSHHEHLGHLGGSGERVPVVLVHPLDGTPSCYHHLVGRLAEDRAVYGLTSSEPHRGPAEELDIPETAARYAAEVADAVTGPVVIAGWSAGAVIAYEVASTLRAIGGEVDTLVLIDPPAPDDHDTLRYEERELARLQSTLRAAAESGDRSARQEAERDPLLVEMGVEASGGITGPGVPVEAIGLWRAHLRALARHHTGDYDGPLAVLSAERRSDAADVVARWQQRARHPVEHRRVDGDHAEILRPPHVDALTGALATVIDRTAADRPASILGSR